MDMLMVQRFERLEKEFGVHFNNRDFNLLLCAVTHPSFTHECTDVIPPENNRRLEYLGDTVLTLCVTTFLLAQYPKTDTGVITLTRSKLLSAENIASVTEQSSLLHCVRLGRGEWQDWFGKKPKRSAANMTSLLKAFIGALYTDAGLEACQKFVNERVCQNVPIEPARQQDIDPASDLQEFLNTRFQAPPIYEDCGASGRGHEQQFSASVRFRGIELARGKGSSKKTARKDAASIALARLREPDSELLKRIKSAKRQTSVAR